MNPTRSALAALVTAALLGLTACSRGPGAPAASADGGEVTAAVRDANAAVAKAADLSDASSFADAKRSLQPRRDQPSQRGALHGGARHGRGHVEGVEGPDAGDLQQGDAAIGHRAGRNTDLRPATADAKKSVAGALPMARKEKEQEADEAEDRDPERA